MSELTVARERCIGMHFFNPVPKMKLIELVRTPLTSDDTVEVCTEVGQRMGKEVVVVKESPGFITTRVNALIGNEAFAMLEAGIASARDIDKALKLGLNHPMGPFELVDLVGPRRAPQYSRISPSDPGRKVSPQRSSEAVCTGGPPGPQDRPRRLRLCSKRKDKNDSAARLALNQESEY